MNRLEAQETHARELLKDPRRAYIEVREDGDEFVATWGGREVRAGNPFGLDSRLSDIGAPQPRNLYLIEDGEVVK